MTDVPLTKAQRAEILVYAKQCLASKSCTGFFMSSNTPNGRLSMHNGDLEGMASDLKEANLFRRREVFKQRRPDEKR